jgi:hypothetical protein
MQKLLLLIMLLLSLPVSAANFGNDQYGSFFLPKLNQATLARKLQGAILTNNTVELIGLLLNGAPPYFSLFHDGISYNAFELALAKERWHILLIMDNFAPELHRRE